MKPKQSSLPSMLLCLSASVGLVTDPVRAQQGGVQTIEISVATEAQLRAALARVWEGPLDISITGMIVLAPNQVGVAIGGVNKVTLRGAAGAPNAGIHFNMIPGPDGGPYPYGKVSADGLQVGCPEVVIERLTFTGYEWSGSAVKLALPVVSARISSCTFVDISTRIYQPMTRPVTASSQVWCGNGIGGGKNANVTIEDSSFLRCCRSVYGHPIYTNGRTVVRNCQFVSSGVNQTGLGVTTEFSQCAYIDPWLIDDPRAGAPPGGHPGSIDTLGSAVASFKRITLSGEFESLFRGQALPVLHIIDNNNYSDMRLSQSFLALGPEGESIRNFQDWMILGFDKNSALPSTVQRLVGADSRRYHAGVQYDLPIPLGGSLVEPRLPGPDAQVIARFFQPPVSATGQFRCGKEVLLTNGTCENVAVVGTEMIITATFQPNRCSQVTVSGVAGIGSDVTLKLRHITGDVNQNGAVNILDLQALVTNLTVPLSQATFQHDVTVNGQINLLDLQMAKNRLNQTAETCP